MKTPVILTWISSLTLALAWLPTSQAQDESNLPPTGSPTIPLSHTTSEIVKLAQARIGESVVLAFITNSGAFNLTPDQLIQLKDLGVSAPIVTAMIQHDQELRLANEQLITASKSDPQPVSPALSVPVTTKLTVTLNEPPLPNPDGTAAAPQPLAGQPAMSLRTETISPAVVDGSRSAFASKPNRYPVREPYPVELTAPIIMVQAAEITPNTLVIVGFPPTSR